MNLTKNRSQCEIVTFAAGAFGVWLSIWGVLLRSVALDGLATLITLFALIAFSLYDND